MAPILSNQLNFRDLGGISTADNRKVKPGLIYRSGDLFSLSAEDILTLEWLRLGTIIDLRAAREIGKRPDKPVKTVRNIIHIDIHDAARDQAEKFLEHGDAKGLETVLVGDYIRMVDMHQEDFRNFLHILAITDHLPLVFHCAAGKDRTGLAAVFLLAALGVGLESIWQDYMATNIYAREFTEKIIRKVTESGKDGTILRPLLEVRPEYLQAALDRIDEKYSGLGAYVKTILNADVDLLREKYLE